MQWKGRGTDGYIRVPYSTYRAVEKVVELEPCLTPTGWKWFWGKAVLRGYFFPDRSRKEAGQEQGGQGESEEEPVRSVELIGLNGAGIRATKFARTEGGVVTHRIAVFQDSTGYVTMTYNQVADLLGQAGFKLEVTR